MIFPPSVPPGPVLISTLVFESNADWISETFTRDGEALDWNSVPEPPRLAEVMFVAAVPIVML